MKNGTIRWRTGLVLVAAISANAQTYEGPIIDMHVHANEQNGMFGLTHPPTLRGETYEGVADGEEQRRLVLEAFEEHNIVKAVVTNGHLWLEHSPDIITLARNSSSVDELEALHRKGQLQVIAEVAPFYQGLRADHPSLAAKFELAERLGVPIGVHIFPGGPNYGIRLNPMLAEMRTANAHPEQLEEILVKHPDLKLYVMHGGWPFVDEVKALMYAYPNVYVDIAVVNWILPQEELGAYLRSLITAGFGDRIMYGSDQMVWPQVIGVGIESVNNVDFLTLEQKEDIFYDNAASFLGLSDEEIRRHKDGER